MKQTAWKIMGYWYYFKKPVLRATAERKHRVFCNRKENKMKFTHEIRDSYDYYTVTSDHGIKVEFTVGEEATWDGDDQPKILSAFIEGGSLCAEEIDPKSKEAEGMAFWFNGIPLTLKTVYLKLESWLEGIQDDECEPYDAPVVL
jgi:hypothetical protein